MAVAEVGDGSDAIHTALYDVGRGFVMPFIVAAASVQYLSPTGDRRVTSR